MKTNTSPADRPKEFATDSFIQLRTAILPFLIAFMLSCFGLSAKILAVVPSPDGGYPGENTAEGTNALFSLTSGIDNTAIGFDALFADTTGMENTAVGVAALSSNKSGNLNTAVGYETLTRNLGNDNTAIGANALLSNTSGHDNTATGLNALLNNTVGILNTAFGAFSLSANIDGRFNTALGGNMEKNTSGTSNVAVGLAAIGAFALQGNTTGHDNSAQGFQALNGNSSGSSNVGIGSHAGANLTTGNNNIIIGANVVGNASDANTIRIGKQGTQKATVIAGIFGTTVSGSTVVVASNGKLGVAISSARFKQGIKPMDKASEAVLKLKPVTFQYKEELDPDKIPQFGLIAEEVEKINPDLVVRGEDGKVMTVRYDAVNAMLLNEFLKEHRRVEEQRAYFELKLAQQQKQIEALTATIQKVSDQVALSRPAPHLVANHQGSVSTLTGDNASTA